MALVDIDEFLVSVSDLIDHSEVVVVAEMSSFDVDAVQPIVMSDLVAPDLLDLRVLELLGDPVVDVLLNQDPVVPAVVLLNGDDFVAHFFRIVDRYLSNY